MGNYQARPVVAKVSAAITALVEMQRFLQVKCTLSGVTKLWTPSTGAKEAHFVEHLATRSPVAYGM